MAAISSMIFGIITSD